MVDLSILTPSIPSRARWLEEAKASVDAQTVRPAAHLIHVSPPESPRIAGVVNARNALCRMAETAWVGGLDDDDLLLPHHVETIAPYLGLAVDVVYTLAEGQTEEGRNVNGLSPAELVGLLEERNVVPSTATVRLEALWGVGGWSAQGFDPVTHLYGEGPVWAEDWHLWLRLARAGARFVCVPVATWRYRDGAPDRITPAAMAILSRPVGRGMLHG
jgi:Glycosyltransferase like family 2